MISLTRMNRQQFFLNPDHIVSIEETPDTVITLFNDYHLIVIEPARVVIDRIMAFKSRVIRRSGSHAGKKRTSASHKRLYSNPALNRSNVYEIAVEGQAKRNPLHVQEI